MHRSIFGNILYLKTSWPDTMKFICVVVRYQSTLNQSHILVSNRISRYLRAAMTMIYGIQMVKNFH